MAVRYIARIELILLGDLLFAEMIRKVSEYLRQKLLVPEAGIEPARPLFTKAADFKSVNVINVNNALSNFRLRN